MKKIIALLSLFTIFAFTTNSAFACELCKQASKGLSKTHSECKCTCSEDCKCKDHRTCREDCKCEKKTSKFMKRKCKCAN